MFALLRAALSYPVRPMRTLRGLITENLTLRFLLTFALVISLFAALRGGLKTGVLADPLRFSSSLGGFFVLGALAMVIGRALGGTGRYAVVTAAFTGSGLPFIAIDALWIAAHGMAEPVPSTLTVLERASWLWALVLLVLGLSEAHGFSRAKASLTVLALAALGGAVILTFMAT